MFKPVDSCFQVDDTGHITDCFQLLLGIAMPLI